MEQGGGHRPQNYRPIFTSPPILRRVAPSHAEKQRALPKLGDIWIPKSTVPPNHFVRLYIPDVEDLFQEGDRLLRADRDPASLVGEYGEAKKENGGSSKNLRMSKTSPLFHPPLHL